MDSGLKRFTVRLPAHVVGRLGNSGRHPSASEKPCDLHLIRMLMQTHRLILNSITIVDIPIQATL